MEGFCELFGSESDGLLLIYPVMPPTRVELEGGVIEQTELDPKGLR